MKRWLPDIAWLGPLLAVAVSVPLWARAHHEVRTDNWGKPIMDVYNHQGVPVAFLCGIAGLVLVAACVAIWRRRKLAFVSAVCFLLACGLAVAWVRTRAAREDFRVEWNRPAGDHVDNRAIGIYVQSGGLRLSADTIPMADGPESA